MNDEDISKSLLFKFLIKTNDEDDEVVCIDMVRTSINYGPKLPY